MKRWNAVRFLALATTVVIVATLLRYFAARMPIFEDVGDDALAFWTRPFFNFGDVGISPAFLVKLLVFLAGLTFAARLFSRVFRTAVLDHSELNEGQKFAFERFAGYFIFALGFVVGAQTVGINLQSLTLLGGALGIGIGFGLQNIASNFISGLILLIERPISVGDRIELENLNGDVVRIAARATWVRTNDNIVIIVPNSELISGRVTNWTANDRRVRFAVPVGVAYASDPNQVREILLAVAVKNPDVLETPAPDVRFVRFGDSSLDFEVRVWTERHVQTPQVLRSDLYFAIFDAFKQHNIEIPFPQRDLHLRSVAEPVVHALRQQRESDPS